MFGKQSDHHRYGQTAKNITKACEDFPLLKYNVIEMKI